MPREHRKRGKRKKIENGVNADPLVASNVEREDAENQQPSWIEASEVSKPALNPEAPFGLCDPDVKAYFRTVDRQLVEWQESGIEKNEKETTEDSNLERRMFFAAALAEIQGKERQLATDPDCAVIVERMIHSMDDLARRIFTNSLLGSVVELAKHRFGSHVLETLLEAGSQTVDREQRGIYPVAQSLPQFAEQPTLVDLISRICQEIVPACVSFVNEPFASHVLRRLFITLVPGLNTFQEKQELRSKRSAGYKSKVGPMKSVFDSTIPIPKAKEVPPLFEALARDILKSIRQKLSANEVRALAVDKVACPTLRVMIAFEALIEESDQPNSLMDSILMGIIAHSRENPSSYAESDYVGTLLRDATGSHLLETVIEHAPEKVVGKLWDTYIVGKLSRLAIHPVANFVVAAGFGRLEGERFASSTEEMSRVVSKCLRLQRIGPITAMVNRASELHVKESEILTMLCEATNTDVKEPKAFIKRLLGVEEMLGQRGKETSDRTFYPIVSVQGALLLQAILHLPAPHNEVVIKSFEQLLPEERLALAHDATSSRVLDVMFESPTVSRKSKRSIVMAYIGEYHLLVDDRFGSRVGDRCWANAEPYLREKIARSLIPHQRFLDASYYGKFFSRKLQTSLLQRRPDEWKAAQIKGNLKPGRDAGASSSHPLNEVKEDHKIMREEVHTERKRKRGEEKDEIDVLFDAVKENRYSKVTSIPEKERHTVHGNDLEKVLNAIREAPKGESRKRHKG